MVFSPIVLLVAAYCLNVDCMRAVKMLATLNKLCGICSHDRPKRDSPPVIARPLCWSITESTVSEVHVLSLYF